MDVVMFVMVVLIWAVLLIATAAQGEPGQAVFGLGAFIGGMVAGSCRPGRRS